MHSGRTDSMWNDDSGDWKGLAKETERPRYEQIAHLVDEFCAGGSVLDVGCGEAVLAGFLTESIRYTGLEPSGKAAKTAGERATCHHATAEDFNPERETWDCIIFNEMLYYSKAPRILMKKFSKFLKPRGIIIISIYQKRASWRDRIGFSMTNARSTKIVRKFISSEGWVVERQQEIANPGREPWWLLVTRPGA